MYERYKESNDGLTKQCREHNNEESRLKRMNKKLEDQKASLEQQLAEVKKQAEKKEMELNIQISTISEDAKKEIFTVLVLYELRNLWFQTSILILKTFNKLQQNYHEYQKYQNSE